jgi:F-type H+-transporting ATPase subunit b
MQIDWWTLALQTVNVLILIWLLARFLFRPVADIVAQRQQKANKLLSDAAATHQQADEARSDVERTRAQIAAERETVIADAQKMAQAERSALLAQAAKDVAKLRAEADAAIARDRAGMEQAVLDRAGRLSVEIARHLLRRMPPATAMNAFVAGLCEQLQALPSQARAAFTSAADGTHAIEVVTAAPLSTEEADGVRRALKEALGAAPVLAFRSDAALIAGIELRAPHAVVRNSWRQDLERIREELSHDDKHVQ